MEMQYLMAVMAVVYTIPLGWLFLLLRTANGRIDEMQKSSYTKVETKEMIELYNAPLLQAVVTVKEDVTEIKQLIGKLFDAQSKKE